MTRWRRHIGRLFLAVGVIGLGLWASFEHLLDIPAYQFWTGILSYLIAAEVAWLLAERWAALREHMGPIPEIVRLPRREARARKDDHALASGGRVCFADILAGRDAPREALSAVLSVVTERTTGLRLFLLQAPPGYGRSTFLRRLARTLLEAKHTVFWSLPGIFLSRWKPLLEAARQQQCYLLIDDFDLRPQVEEWLYEFRRQGMPLILIGTAAPPSEPASPSGLFALRPISLLDEAHIFDIRPTTNDIFALAHHLRAEEQLRHGSLALPEKSGLLGFRRLVESQAEEGLWRALERRPVPEEARYVLAWAGAAELGFTLPLWRRVLGFDNLEHCQEAGLVVSERGLIWPPHSLTCTEFLAEAGPESKASHEALERLAREALALEPFFAASLFYALAQHAFLKAPAGDVLQRLAATEIPSQTWSPAILRSWQRALAAYDLLPTEILASDYPPELMWQIQRLYKQGDWPAVIRLADQLQHDPVYRDLAFFALALARAQQGDPTGAEEALTRCQRPLKGLSYLRGVLAEQRGDLMQALDYYEASHKADEIPLPSARALAWMHLRVGSARAALPLFEALLAHSPLDASLYAGLAIAYLQSGHPQRAAAQSARAIHAGLDPADARKAVAEACLRFHAYPQAAAELEACLSYAPEDPEALDALALACHALGRFEREAQCLAQLAKRDPENASIQFRQARCLSSQGQFETAWQILGPLLAGESPNVEILLLGAEIASALGRPERQRELAEEALAQGDTSGWAYFWLAETLPAESPQARQAYQAAIAQLQTQARRQDVSAREQATLWQAIALAAQRIGDDEQAREAAQRARQAANVAEALDLKIHSLVHRQAVSPTAFRESLPFANA